MNIELENRIARKYPFMKRTNNNTAYSEYGIECGDGWYRLIRSMCAEITDYYNKNNVEIDILIKRVSGESLCVDYSFKHKHGQDFYEDIYSITQMYQMKSLHICENCGRRGKCMNNFKWYQVLCNNCFISAAENNGYANCRPNTPGYTTSNYVQIAHYIKTTHCFSFNDLKSYAREKQPEWWPYIRSNKNLIMKALEYYAD